MVFSLVAYSGCASGCGVPMDVPIGCASGCDVLVVGVRVSFRGVGVVGYSSCTALAVVVSSLCVCLGVPMDVLAALAVVVYSLCVCLCVPMGVLAALAVVVYSSCTALAVVVSSSVVFACSGMR